MLLHLSLCSGGLLLSMRPTSHDQGCLHPGISTSRGSLHPGGFASGRSASGGSASKGSASKESESKSGWVDLPPSTMGYGQQVGGTHPTGMHSC